MQLHHNKYRKFFDSDAGKDIKKLLQKMDGDNSFTTKTTYTPDSQSYPDNQIPFVDKHMNYLSTHPAVNPMQYIANLRLITRKR